MKKVSLVLATLLMLSCGSTKQIGSVNMISNRNIDSSAEYQLLKTYMGTGKKEIKKSKSENMEEAIDQVVRSTPGGEYLMNVKIYLVDGKYLAVEGDVWGLNDNINFRGFVVGDNVQWKKGFKEYSGVITDLKNSDVCTIRVSGSDEIVEVEYEELVKINSKE